MFWCICWMYQCRREREALLEEEVCIWGFALLMLALLCWLAGMSLHKPQRCFSIVVLSVFVSVYYYFVIPSRCLVRCRVLESVQSCDTDAEKKTCSLWSTGAPVFLRSSLDPLQIHRNCLKYVSCIFVIYCRKILYFNICLRENHEISVQRNIVNEIFFSVAPPTIGSNSFTMVFGLATIAPNGF